MRGCNVRGSNGAFLKAYLSEDNRVLFDFCRKDVAADPYTTPAMVMDNQNYYLPKDAIDACSESAYVLLPFEVEGKWGYCDRWMGEVVHEPQWEWCDHFVVTKQGREVARFNTAEDRIIYSEKVYEDSFDPLGAQYNGRWGLMDLGGTEVIAPDYQFLSPIKDGLMLAKKEECWGVVDATGKIVLPISYDAICFFRGFGFLTRKGEVFSVYHTSGLSLIEDLPAMPQRWECGFQRWYYNNYVCSDCTPYDSELEANRLFPWAREVDSCMWYEHNGQYTVLRGIPGENRIHASIGTYGEPCKSFEKAELVLDAAFESVVRILGSRAEFKRWNGAKNADRQPSTTAFANICRVTDGTKWGYCNFRTGEMIQSPAWSYFEPFCKTSGKNRYVARFNRAPEQTVLCDFRDRFVSDDEDLSDGQWGLMNLCGRVIAPPIYQQLSPVICGEYYIAQKDGSWGILDCYGRVVVPFQYTGICEVSSGKCLFLLRKGMGSEATYKMIGYNLEVLRDGLTRMPEQIDPRIAAKEAEELCKSVLKDSIIPELNREEEEHLLAQLRYWAMSCRYRELYDSYDRMLKVAIKELNHLRAASFRKEDDCAGTTGKPCRVYYANCCGSIINPEQDKVWYNGKPEYEFCEAVMTEDGTIRIAEKRVLNHRNVIRYVKPNAAKSIAGTTAPYSFECDGQWGYCAEDGEILAYPVAAFCDGMPWTDNSGFYANENPLMRFCLDPWSRFEIGDFWDGDQTEKKNECACGRWGAFDGNGQVVIPPVYQYLGRSGQNSDLILAKKNDFWGALNGDGEVIVPFVWDDIWLDVAYGCLAKKNTRHGPRYAIMGEDGTVLIGDLPSIPHHLDGYYDRIVKNGDTVCVLHCRLRYVHGEDQIRMGHKWYSSCEEAKEEMNGVFTADEEENDAENSL